MCTSEAGHALHARCLDEQLSLPQPKRLPGVSVRRFGFVQRVAATAFGQGRVVAVDEHAVDQILVVFHCTLDQALHV
jgi:hypothetical protein